MYASSTRLFSLSSFFGRAEKDARITGGGRSTVLCFLSAEVHPPSLVLVGFSVPLSSLFSPGPWDS